MSEHRQTAPEDRVSGSKKLAYGMGAIAENGMQNGVGNMANPFFNVGLGVAPSLLGIAAMIFRIWDAITDPVMGYISDRTESRFGRRRQYIILGAIAGGLLYALMWWCPRGMSTGFYLAWYMSISLLFYSAYTVFGVPYLALGYEMSSDYHERTRVMSYRTWFQSVVGICLQWLLWLSQRDLFGNDTVRGMRWVGIGMGALILVMGVVPGLFLKERKLTPDEMAATRESVKLRHALDVLKVKAFRYVLGGLALAIVGLFTVHILGFYINVYYLYGGDMKAASTMLGFQGTFYHLTCMASIPMIAWVSTRIGKKRVLLAFLSLAVIGTLLKWVLFTPENPWLQLIVVMLMAPGLSAAWTIFASMTADVTDLDELENGTRREGAFGGLYGWVQKFGFALCIMIAGYVVEWTGFDVALGAGQTEHTIFWLRVCYTVVPATGLLATMLIVWRYPITQVRAHDIREQLEARKAATQAGKTP